MTLHAALVLHALRFMVAVLPPHGGAQRAEYRAIAEAIVDATPAPDDEIQLASIAADESRFTVHALNRRSGARGPFQLLGGHIPRGLAAQAREALRRWKIGMCFYTGETLQAPDCPLASIRYGRAVAWSYAHPFEAP